MPQRSSEPVNAPGAVKYRRSVERVRTYHVAQLSKPAIRASESSYSASPAFTWRLPITSIANMNMARRTAATKTDRQKDS